MSKGPCAACTHQPECKAFTGLDRSLFRTARYLRPRPHDEIDKSLDVIVTNFVSSLNDKTNASWVNRANAGLYLSALFDFCVNGLYVGSLVDFEGRFTQQAVACGPDAAYFPFVWMCPACVANGRPLADCYLPGARREEGRDYPRSELLAKPGGRAIGDAGIKVLRAILRAVLAKTRPTAIMREGGGEHGEFDLTITDDDLLIFAEVKAKPLIAHSLRLQMATQVLPNQHKWITIDKGTVVKMDLYLAASGVGIALNAPGRDLTWPLRDLAVAASNPTIVKAVIEAWSKHLAGYKQWEGEPRETRWHRFGCGNFSTGSGVTRVERRVANTKELPGLDRTDDIKKGAAQLLKFSRFKFDCKKDMLRAILVGNTYAETHGDDYITPLVRLHVSRADEVGSRQEWIFDAVIGLTDNRINAPELEEFFSFEKILN